MLDYSATTTGGHLDITNGSSYWAVSSSLDPVAAGDRVSMQYEHIIGGSGNETLIGGEAGNGNDTLNFSAYAVQVTVGLGAGTASGPAGTDTILGFV
ncbi:hypothetical protein [Antarctobacter sp.]|uniref:hypothetical protein n=1 Tax=Antarctobacter sp. TaxID=1872577 RepID=UPI002B27B539|nr:hypothetical protein [Antarctobacter sp.]